MGQVKWQFSKSGTQGTTGRPETAHNLINRQTTSFLPPKKLPSLLILVRLGFCSFWFLTVLMCLGGGGGGYVQAYLIFDCSALTPFSHVHISFSSAHVFAGIGGHTSARIPAP